MLQIHFDSKAMQDGFFATARRLPRALGIVAVFALSMAPARAENAYCSDLKAQIAQAASADSGRYRAAAAKQQGELNRTAAYGRSIGCERQQFLFFGEAPPPQCGQINARIAQMRASLAALQQGADSGRKLALTARYDAQCRDRPKLTPAAAPPVETPHSIFDDLFGSAPPQDAGFPRETPELRRVPMHAQPDDPLNETEPGEPDGYRVGGSLAICVRLCVGGFFPVSYSARRGNLDELNALCKALCPNTEATLYTKSPWGELNTAVSIDGDSYADHPNALKFQKTHVSACGCKPPDKSWAEALADAERLLAASNSKDVVVTEEQAEQLSRPQSSGDTRDRGGDNKKQPTRRDAPTNNGSTGSIAAPAGGQEQGEWRETVGPDGVKRRVRVVAPTL